MSYSAVDIALILLGAVCGGFVNGLTGFGTALTAIPIWVQVLNPPVATALAAAAGVTGQLQTLHLIRHAIVWRTVAPFLVAGLIGVPIGTSLLPLVDQKTFKLSIGVVMIAYCSFVLLAARFPAGLTAKSTAPSGEAKAGERVADILVGFGGGLMSGLAGLSGPLPIVWSTFKPWPRDRKRALIQTFNTVILSATLISIFAAGLLSEGFWTAFALAVPGTLAGVRLGSMVYRRLDDRRFDRLVVALLLATGISLVAGTLLF